jgi:two-component system, OmpR family, sensor histidine kinase SenX3
MHRRSPGDRPYPRRVDTTSAIAVGVAIVAVLVAAVPARGRIRQSRAIDDALVRLGAPSPSRRRRRVRALGAALDDLEQSASRAQRERARLAGAVHTAPIGIIVTDDAGVVATANPAASRFLGSRVGEVVAEARIHQTIDQAILTRNAITVEVEMHTPKRSVLEVSAVPLDFGIESVGAVAFIVDATEGRRVAAMRRDFIANVSHDLKTPMAAVAVLAETLAGGIADRATVTALADRLMKEAHRLSNLVDDILDLSQVEAAEPYYQPVAMQRVIDEVGSRFSELAADRGVDLVVEPVPADARVSGDPRQLTTLVANLVDNAIEYTPASDDLRPRVLVSVTVADGRAITRVEDRGMGISDTHLDRIFERFYRVDPARSRDTGGTGLGLSIVRHIARNHRGDVTVESVEGEGSTFTVDLPLWQPAPRPGR